MRTSPPAAATAVGARLDLVGDDGVTSALELFYAPDLDDVRPRTHDVRAHGVEKVGQVHDVRLLGGVFDDGQAVGQGRGDEDVHGRTHGDHVQVDLRPVQAAGGGGGVDEAVLHLDLRAHGGEALEMLVDGTHAQVTAAGRGNLRPAKAAQQCADEIVGRTDLAGQLIGNVLLVYLGAVQLHSGGVDGAHVGAQVLHDPKDHGYVADVGYIFNPADSIHQKRGGKNGHSGVLRTADLHLTVERLSAVDHILCQNGTFFYIGSIMRNHFWFISHETGQTAPPESERGPLPASLSENAGQMCKAAR